ncbi:hypothetical protein KCU62_g4031, partial [Aureobasidium sp. EXF-3399]
MHEDPSNTLASTWAPQPVEYARDVEAITVSSNGMMTPTITFGIVGGPGEWLFSYRFPEFDESVVELIAS